jgi:hypothetical protein
MDSKVAPRANLKKYIKVDGKWRFVPVLKPNGGTTPAAEPQWQAGAKALAVLTWREPIGQASTHQGGS